MTTTTTGTPLPFAETTPRAGCHVHVDMRGAPELPAGEPFAGHPLCDRWAWRPPVGQQAPFDVRLPAFACVCVAGHFGRCRFERVRP